MEIREFGTLASDTYVGYKSGTPTGYTTKTHTVFVWGTDGNKFLCEYMEDDEETRFNKGDLVWVQRDGLTLSHQESRKYKPGHRAP